MNWLTRNGTISCPPYSIVRETRGDYSLWMNLESKYGVLKRDFTTAEAAKVFAENHAKVKA